ncbi:uncharacterized protein LOC111023653 [Momordica charantia]|uniref:Uncharacterized protein LOC111023653 n=1 Tax=Momordica charantia TaxID=3673 RepID=A0A6J1DRM7_MOMCH|nr:uncharacterized protein LOC111023653 [Momordica charantia]
MDEKNRLFEDYELGVESFIEFGFHHANGSKIIRCPCLKCGTRIDKDAATIRNHLYEHGIDQSYRVWFWHGEEHAPRTDEDRLNDEFNKNHEDDNDLFDVIDMVQTVYDEISHVPKSFENMFDNAKKPLYPGCKKFTKLSALVRLYNLKVRYSWTNSSFSELLSVISDFLPELKEMPKSMYEAKKALCSLGLNYEKIDACPNDCCLYRKEYIHMNRCPFCSLSRWKLNKDTTKEKEGVPAKQLWYFPIIPRFLGLFRSFDHAKNLTWHSTGRKVDGVLRHPANSPS